MQFHFYATLYPTTLGIVFLNYEKMPLNINVDEYTSEE